ncbi:hypothetical protein [Mycolicibacter arupensis]|uniref:Uncharacterized protein n=1 Tax=Mycolicibacter arupensis TaxID=342002 RepID=A0A5C7Y282_9MYCO|nr:hypothetical protein [Mycolicibacter arupensis]TXI55907.1 MAG: hypothetical protein E6Q54_11810 [Mycolicibacter arupensis]
MTTDYVIGERAATEKQLDYILRLADCKFFSQVAKVTRVGMTVRAKRGDLTRDEASTIIDDLLAQRDGTPLPSEIPVEQRAYKVIEYRTWSPNYLATSGYSPSTSRYFTSGQVGDPNLAQTERKSGELCTTVWTGTGDAAAAARALKVHRAVHAFGVKNGGDVHGALLKQLMPGANPLRDLITDLTTDQLVKALRRKAVRAGWVAKALRKWAANDTLLSYTSPETAVALATLRGAVGGDVQVAVAAAVALDALTAELTTDELDATAIRRTIPLAVAAGVTPDGFRDGLAEAVEAVEAFTVDGELMVPLLAAAIEPWQAAAVVEEVAA